MRYHWMSVFDLTDVESMKKLLKQLDRNGYYSVLHVYHSTQPSNWMKAARIVDETQQIKHMIAVRPYSISPEFFVMMYDAFEEICKDRIMFNIVPGRILDDENVFENLLYISDLIDTVEKRIDYADKWLENVLSIKKIPEIVIAGIGDKSLDLANKYGDYSVFTVELYNNDRSRVNPNAKKMCMVNFVIRDTYKEAELAVKDLRFDQKSRTFYGTKDSILEQVKELELSGITDIMIRKYPNDNKFYKIHEFVKENGTR
jgi:alkanesulfonate monooxygenase SsuD/methylene tetrahydromethanopterin reductase-like flavin-dependent oxidoreductase (luciferase family)